MSQKYVVINSDEEPAFYDTDIHQNIPLTALEISDTDYQLYFSNQIEYAFSKNNEAAELTKLPLQYIVRNGTYMEVYKIKSTDTVVAKRPAKLIDALNTEYDSQFAALATSLGLATLSGDQAVIDGIKSDYTDLKAEYQTKLEAINNG